MIAFLSIVIASLSLLISGATVYLTLIKPGRLKMTRPTLIVFAFDGLDGPPKVFLRTLLYSTARRGQIIEGMFVTLRRAKTIQTFSGWGYGDKPITWGSGLYVGPEGLTSYHHFLPPRDATDYQFLAGTYTVEIHASVVNSRAALLLSQTQLSLTEAQASALKNKGSALFFEWHPDSEGYHATIDTHPKSTNQYLTHLTEGHL
jgi:hypothetical protein